MHIRRVEIQNIRSIKHLVWELPEEQNGAGWHVILGDNGSGKTSFARSVASLCIDARVPSLSQFLFGNLIRVGCPEAHIQCSVIKHEDFDKTNSIDLKFFNNYIHFKKNQSEEESVNIQYGVKDGPWITWSKGWFAFSFGANRQINGKKITETDFLKNFPTLRRHAYLSNEQYGITDFVDWLQKNELSKLQGNEDAARLSSNVIKFINQSGFLSHDAEISGIIDDGIYIKDGAGNLINLEEMSDGYKSILALTLELIKQLAECFGTNQIFDENDTSKIIVPGVVQIDEIDAHLHPSWQRRIGQWFKKHFPNMQFIVTTHSPLICWAADSVFVLPTPGTDETGRFLTEEELNRVKYGSIQEAYMLDAFGEIGRSEERQKKLVRLTELNNKEWDGELTDADKKELQELRAALPLSALRMKG